jgi:hypothetical protein
VNVTLVEGQIEVLLALMLMVGVTALETVMVIALLVAVVVVAHGAFEVSTHVITSPFTKPDAMKLFVPVPTFPPFFFH